MPSIKELDLSWLKKSQIKFNSLMSGFLSNTKLTNILLPRGVKQLITEWFSLNGNLTTIISWIDHFSACRRVALNSYALQEFYLLGDDLKYDYDYSRPEQFPFYDQLNWNKNLKFYVKNEKVKNALKDLNVPDGRIVVDQNIEQKLIKAGKIPQDW